MTLILNESCHFCAITSYNRRGNGGSETLRSDVAKNKPSKWHHLDLNLSLTLGGPKLPSTNLLLAQYRGPNEEGRPYLLLGVEVTPLATEGEVPLASGAALVHRARSFPVTRRQRPREEDACYECIGHGGQAQGQRIEERQVQEVDGQVESVTCGSSTASVRRRFTRSHACPPGRAKARRRRCPATPVLHCAWSMPRWTEPGRSEDGRWRGSAPPWTR